MEYQICNFKFLQENLKNLKIGEYYFEKVQDYEEIVEKKLYKPGATKWPLDSQGKIVKVPEQEGSHQVTCIATAEQEEKDSVLLLGGKGIKDILLLYNFFARRSSCVQEDRSVVDHRFDEVGIKFEDKKVFELIQTAFQTIREPNWLDKNKESIFPFHWLMQSRVSRIFEVSYVSRWVAFELLWHSKTLGGKFNGTLKSIKKLVMNSSENVKFYERFLANIRHCIIHQKGICDFEGFLAQFDYSGSGLTDDHRKFFAERVSENNFNEFKHSSRYILDSLLSIFFAKIFGIEDVSNHIPGDDLARIKDYFQSLKISTLMSQ